MQRRIDEIISTALRATGRTDEVEHVDELGGSGWCRVIGVRAGGEELVAKTAPAARGTMLEDEADGLAALAATKSVDVPCVIAQSVEGEHGVLIMSRLAGTSGAITRECWRRFGEALARLHLHEGPNRYGYHRDNHLGGSRQINTWHDDWVMFNSQCRLGPQLEWAENARVVQADEAREIRRVIDTLDRLVPARPRVSLLHGDLWSGNAIAHVSASGDAIAVIDPACSYGDALADIAMMKLFGGFLPIVFEAWEKTIGCTIADQEPALRVYQLYHVLNHVNLFGRGYVGQAMALARELT